MLKIGVIPAMGGAVQTSATYVADFVAHAEASGFDSVWLGEHPALPVHSEQAYPGADEGLPAPSAAPLPDPLEWLAFAAAHSTTLLLGTAVLVLPLHHPVVLAKRLATLDQVSGGRVRLGVGVGWNRQEYAACGADFSRRGRYMDEAIDALRTLWREEEAGFDGSLVSFEPVYSFPKPLRGFVPIDVGASAAAGARRAGRTGDGFLPFERDLDELADRISEMKRAAEAAGRDPDAVEITALGGVKAARVERLMQLGVHRMLVFSDDIAGLTALSRHLQNLVA